MMSFRIFIDPSTDDGREQLACSGKCLCKARHKRCCQELMLISFFKIGLTIEHCNRHWRKIIGLDSRFLRPDSRTEVSMFVLDRDMIA